MQIDNVGLLSEIQPQNCVDPQLLILKDDCFRADQSLPVYLDHNHATQDSSALIVANSLPAKSFFQVALLTDPKGKSTLLNGSTCNIGAGSFDIPGLANQITIQSFDLSTT